MANLRIDCLPLSNCEGMVVTRCFRMDRNGNVEESGKGKADDCKMVSEKRDFSKLNLPNGLGGYVEKVVEDDVVQHVVMKTASKPFEYANLEEEQSGIAEFFKGRSVLITGALGFMGKVLVEKLLRSCPDLHKVYLIVRPKRNSGAESRVQDQLLKSKVMDRIRKECPSVLSKVAAVEGDVSLPGLGLKKQDTSVLMQNVSVVFHVAANVRFTDTLREATRVNLEGTKNTADFAKTFRRLSAFVHVSTAFSNSNRRDIDEIVYPSTIPPNDYLTMLSTLTEKELVAKTPDLIQGHPNTYTFTKLLAENYLALHCKDLPVSIVRPAAVLSAWKEPFPGWVENKFGPIGLVLALGIGAIHVIQADEETAFNVIPVDIGVNHMIAAAWDVATNPGQKLRVINGAKSPFEYLKMKDFKKICYDAIHEFPLDDTFRYPSCMFIQNRTLYNVASFFQHYVPAAAADLYFFVTGQKPRVIRAYNKILGYLDDYTFFNLSNWQFRCDALLELQNRLSCKDKQDFNLLLTDLEWPSFFRSICCGLRRYLKNQTDDSLTIARKELWRLYYKTTIFQAFLVAAVSYGAWMLF